MNVQELLQQFDFDPATHIYRLDGVVVPSVTQVLAPLNSWENVPADILDRACDLGRAVHLATELDDLESLDENSLSSEVGGYLEAWRRFRRETGVKPLLIEHRTRHLVLRFAGTLDREGVYADELTVLEIKSGARVRAHGVQLAGYALARKAELALSGYPQRRAVYLHDDSRYEAPKFTKTSDYPTFIGLLNLHQWRQEP